MTVFLLQFIILLYGFLQISALSPFVIELETLESHYNPNIYSNVSLKLITWNNRKVINGSVIYARDLDQFQMTIIGKKIRRNGSPTTLVNLTVNVCEAYNGVEFKRLQLSQLLITYIYRTMKNVPRKCPVKKGTEILLDKFFIDAEQMPPYLPEISFKFIIGIMYKKMSGCEIIVTGAVISKEMKKLSKT